MQTSNNELINPEIQQLSNEYFSLIHEIKEQSDEKAF